MKHFVIGKGEIGTAIATILGADTKDLDHEPPFGQYDVLHICFPPSEKFIQQVKDYQEQYKPSITIIHSTVPVGTSEQLGAVHSPVRGVHPFLEEGIREFVKFFGGKDAEKAAKFFSDRGIRTLVTSNSKDTEAGKIWDTTQYGLTLIVEKEIHAYCEENGLNFDIVYSQFNNTYNDGYERLGMLQHKRPILKHMEGKILGHCVIQNLELIPEQPTARYIKEQNDRI